MANNGMENDQSRKLGLPVVYEDSDLVVIRAPTEDQLIEILLGLLRESPKTVKELHSMLSGLASEDKIRRALTRLVNERRVLAREDGRYVFVGI